MRWPAAPSLSIQVSYLAYPTAARPISSADHLRSRLMYRFRRRVPKVCSTRSEGASVVMASTGKHTIVFDFKYDGPGQAKGGTGVLSVDGKEVARKTIRHTIPAVMSID